MVTGTVHLKEKGTDEAQVADLTRELREKEILLGEVYHRMKNNLQIISSLLNLQARRIADPKIGAMFMDSIYRIESIALVHDKLYRSESLARVNFAKYLPDLMNNLFLSCGASPARIRKKVDVGDISLDIDTAVPLCLVVTELVSNCLRHAFPAGTKGEIRIGFHQDTEGKYMLTVGDTGVGFPKEPDFRRTESLGLKLVNLLVGQLNGTIEMDRTEGTQFRIAFLPENQGDKVKRG